MRFQNGMNKVWEPAGEKLANIIFVHGLFGHPWKTWADEAAEGPDKPFWPETLLPRDSPRTGIYTFGYDADATGSAGLNTVLHHGTNLLSDLLSLDAGPTCPYIFIVHSLGGLVVKEALNQSSNASDIKRKSVVENTHGIIFLGTPHRGSAAASYGKIAFTMAKVFAGQSSNTKLLRALEKDSEVLERISRAFYATWDKYPDLHICSLHEEKEMRKMGVFRLRVVPPESARIGHVREELGSIPEDHRYMAKFRKISDPGYARVIRVIHRWLKQLDEQRREDLDLECRECLESLNDPESRSRVLQVGPQHSGTFEWLFSDAVPFSKWLADDEGRYSSIFWITGKPGSGKSTCMRFAMQDSRLLRLLPDGEGTPIGYFFHLRGKNRVQKSMQGMLLELLYQMLLQFSGNGTIDRILPDYRQLRREQRVNKPSWPKDVLKRCIRNVISSDGCHPMDPPGWGSRRRFVLFIDALDENAEVGENLEVLEFIHELSTHARIVLKICLASRPWPQFQHSLANDHRIPSFAIHDFTRVDIERFTTGNLIKALNPTVATPAQHAHIRELSQSVIEKAHGVFVWVKFVVRELCRHLIDGSSMGTIRSFLSSLPDELGELYEYTMRRIPADYRLETAVALRILLCSLRPLSLRTLHCATMACILQSILEPDISDAALRAWLASRSGGLIELAVDYASLGPFQFDRPQPGRYDSVWKVQFIHQTVQEYVHRGIPGLDWASYPGEWWQDLDGNFLIYRAVAADFPPLEPLRGLAKDVFEHLRTVDQLLDQQAQSARRRFVWGVNRQEAGTASANGKGLHPSINISRRSWGYDRFYTPDIDTAARTHDSYSTLILRHRIQVLTCLRSIFTSLSDHHYGMSEDDFSYFMTSQQLPTFSQALLPDTRRIFGGAAMFYAGLVFEDLLQWRLDDLPAEVYADLLAMAALGPRAVQTTTQRRVKMFESVHNPYPAPVGRAGKLGESGMLWLVPDFSPTLNGPVPVLLGETRHYLIGHLAALQHHEQVDEDGRLRLAEALLEIGHRPGKDQFFTRQPANGVSGATPEMHNHAGEIEARYDMSFGEYCQRFKGSQWVQMCIRHGLLEQDLDAMVRGVVDCKQDSEKDIGTGIAAATLVASSFGRHDVKKGFCEPQLRATEQVILVNPTLENVGTNEHESI